MNYSTKQISEMENCAIETVQKWCVRVGLVKVGRDYVFSDTDLEAFRNRRTLGWQKGLKKNLQESD